ncbi:MAG: type II toxin-antitoxin system Phd/YefM family antitoxin [Thermomicrobiales bacterium]|nr:type II toxin-antitoxin system Phd/YefM family antitoxin [Thermomicrobiales bacterium]
METTITATELSRRLSDVLNRVKYRGERFVVQRNGETIATITPFSPPPAVTLDDIIAKVGDFSVPGDGFADDLEAIQAEQPPAEFPEWPD